MVRCTNMSQGSETHQSEVILDQEVLPFWTIAGSYVKGMGIPRALFVVQGMRGFLQAHFPIVFWTSICIRDDQVFVQMYERTDR